MLVTFILLISILLQFVAAIMAFRLIPLTGKRTAWSFIALALMLMAMRRGVPLIRMLSGDTIIQPDLSAELIAMVISLLMVVGISRIAPIFTENKRAESQIMTAIGALRESERQWRITFDATNNAIWILDKEQRVLQSNKAAEKFFNRPYGEFIGKCCWEIVHGTARPIAECPLLRARKSLRRETMELQIGEGWFEVIVDPVLDKNGEYEGAVHTISDITQRKRAEEALREKEAQYHNLADSGLALIWTSGTDKLCNYFNQPWLKFTGRTLEEELGNGWAEGVHPEDLESCIQTYVTAFDKREAFDMEYRLRHVSGKYRWIRDLGVPNFDIKGEFIGYIGHCFDITGQKQAEEEIRRFNKNLEQKVQERTAELQKTITQLEETNRVFVGRELKMAELKEKIAEMEKNVTREE